MGSPCSKSRDRNSNTIELPFRSTAFEHIIASMVGAILNAAGILLGGMMGLAQRKPLSEAHESSFKVGLGVFAVFYGLRLSWMSFSGSLLHVLKQLLIVLLALSLGKLTGQVLRLQSMSNRLGRDARERISTASPRSPQAANNGLRVTSVLFCAAPLGILGAVQDGLSAYYYPLALKAVMDGLATMGFVRLFGPSAMLSALPVLALEGTLALLCERFLQPMLGAHNLVDPLNAVGGLLVFSVALVILGLKKVELADYLPSLAVAPLLAWFFPF